MHIECNNYDKGNKPPQQALVILGLVKVCDINKLLVEICYILLGPFGLCLLCRRPKVLQWNVRAKESTKIGPSGYWGPFLVLTGVPYL